MPGRQSGDNKLGLTPYIVGKVTGEGCLYGGATAIQDAIDDAFAAGGGVVGIRASAVPYVENLTLRAGVDLYGFCVDGRLPSAIGKVVIEGNHTFTQVGGFGATISQYITYSAPAGDAFTMIATGGGSAILAMKFCGIEAQTVAGQRAILMNPDLGSSCQFSTDNTQINSDSHCFEVVGAGSGSAFLSLGNTNSSTGDILNISGGGSGSLNGQWTQVSGALSILNSVTGFGSSTFNHSNLFASFEAFLFGAGGGSTEVAHCTIISNAVSGNWIDGPVGTVTFNDIQLASTAQSVGAAITQTKPNWQPYGETAAVALGSVRGTSSYNSTQFSVVDGFVSALPAGLFPWIDQGVGVQVNSNQGNFATAGITLVLPSTPGQGDVCKFKCTTAAALLIAVPGFGQTIQYGDQLGTVLTSSRIGDAMELTYRVGGNVWFANSSIGNWTVTP